MFDIVLDGLFGAVAGGLGWFLARAVVDRKKKPQLHTTIFVAICVFSFQTAKLTLRPMLLTWKNTYDTEEFLKKDRLFSALLADNPELRASFRTAILKAMQTGDRVQAMQAGHALLVPVLPKYLSKASDEAVLSFAHTSVKTLETLESRDINRCFQYLFPRVAGSTVLTEDEGKSEILEAMRAMVETARENPHQDSDEKTAGMLLEGLRTKLSERYGEDLLHLQKPEAANADWRKVCTITIDLYREILRLPSKDAASLLRMMFAK